MWQLPLFLLFASAGMAQHSHKAPGEKPATLLPGMGKHQHRIATSIADAQKFFDQGLNMRYGFNRHEAWRSFKRASELDPRALMPRVGMALSLGPHVNMDLDGDMNLKEACAAIREARNLRAAAPAREQAWFDAAAALCPEYKPAEYTPAVRRLMEAHPDDLDAATLYAESLMIPVRWRWFRPDGTPNTGTEEAIRVLEAVLRRNPEHPGANHFFIHVVESSTSPERAIPSAQRLMGIVPGAGHLVHMPGHIWMLMGDFELVATTNERAVQVDREYFQRTGVQSGAYPGYFVHNLHFVAVARQMQGNWKLAIQSANEVVKEALPFVEEMPGMVDAFVPMPIFAMLRFSRWDDILALPAQHPKLPATQAVWHMARAITLNAKGRGAEAAKEAEAFEAARAKVPADWVWLNNKALDVLAVAAEVLRARLAPSDDAALPHWRRAIELQDQLVNDEPPPFFYPVRESLGGALLRASRPAEAEAAFRDGIRRSPRNGRMLFGLLESLKAQNKTDAAELVQREFQEAWKRADVTLRIADL